MFNRKFNYLEIGIILLAALVGIFFIILKQKTSLMGNLFHDTLVFDSISYAISQGLRPSIDFYATMIVPFYMRYFANNIADGAFAENIELWIYSAVLTIVFFALLYKKVKPIVLLAISLLMIVFMMVRLNYINTIAILDNLYLFSHAGSYNRFLDMLMAAVILSAIPSLDSRIVKYTRILFYTIVLLFGLYTKISTFPIFLLLITTIVLLSQNYKIMDLMAVYILVALGVISVWYFTGIGKEYFQFLGHLGDYKTIRLKEELIYQRYVGFLSHSLYDAIIIIISLITYNRLFKDELSSQSIKKDVLLKNSGMYLRVSPVLYILVISLFSLASVTMFTLTNYGDMGFFPLIALFYVARKTLYIHKIELSKNAKRYFIILFFAFFAVYVYKFTKAVGGRIYYMQNTEFVSLSNALDTLDKNGSIHKENKIYDKYYVNKDKIDELRSNKDVLETLTPVANLFTHANYLTSFYLFDEINAKLDTLNITKDKSIYLIDFPAYYFAMLRDSRIPKYTYPFLLYNHEIGKEFHPKAQDMFRDVDVVIVTDLSLPKNNKMYLNGLYGDYIDKNYDLLYRNKYYKIYEKKENNNESK